MERLTGLDAAFLYIENPTNHMHVAMTMVLDPSTVPGGYSFEGIKEFIGGRIHLVPPFRRRLVEVPLNLAHPVWIEDPDFDLDFHIRRIGCPAPGGRRELGEMAGQIASTPLDRTPPLGAWVVEGLKQDRIGVVTKVHHAAIDGASGAELMVHLFDLEPGPSDPPPPVERELDHIPNDLELLGHAAASRFRKTVALPKLIGETVQAVNRVVQGRRDPDTPVGAAPLGAPNTSWCGPLSPLRTVGFARVPLDDVRALKTAFGCTVNDVVLGLCAGTLRGYLLDRDELPEEPLVAACPVSVRPEGETSAGNKVSAMFTTLDTHLADPAERIRAIQACTVGAKQEHLAVGADMLQNWAEYAAPNTFNLASRLYASWGLAGSHRPIHNVIISNVPGPAFPLYYAGAEMVAAYPMGPVMEGVGLNITVLSYRGSVDFGFMVDRELVPDVWNIADRVKEALEELQVAAGITPTTSTGGDIDEPGASKGGRTAAPTARKVAAAKKGARARRATKAPRTTKAANTTKTASASKTASGVSKASKVTTTRSAERSAKSHARPKATPGRKAPAATAAGS